jgi:hypothetical protein
VSAKASSTCKVDEANRGTDTQAKQGKAIPCKQGTRRGNARTLQKTNDIKGMDQIIWERIGKQKGKKGNKKLKTNSTPQHIS